MYYVLENKTPSLLQLQQVQQLHYNNYDNYDNYDSYSELTHISFAISYYSNGRKLPRRDWKTL